MALVAAAAWALPAAGQQAPRAGAPLSLALPPYPAESGKPLIWDPLLSTKSGGDRSCAPAWTCRVQLFGAIQKYGAVGLKGTAFTW